MLFAPKRALVLAPHADDGELGAGALVSRLVRLGVAVHEAVFSIARESVPKEFPEDVLARELQEAAAELGVPAARIKVFDFPVRKFPSLRQEILEELVALKRALAPDLVLVHASTDVHQDHHTVHEEAVRAFKDTTILGYELPWNTIEFRAQAVIAVEESDLEKKLKALARYASQAHRKYVDEEVVRGLARTRGAAIGVRFAEAFEVVRWVVR
jgi:LmbE family N-acetylglucosaminyl deacetylase